MRELRPHIKAIDFAARVLQQQKEGYQLAYLELDRDVRSVTGFRIFNLLFSGRTLDVPSCFIAGKSDWGIYQRPGGDMIRMQRDVLTNMVGGCHLIEGAGHWVQQEQPEKVSALLVAFLKRQPG